MEIGIKDFTRKLGPVAFFSENPGVDTPDSSLVKTKSNFCPSQNQNSTLESVINFLQKQSFYGENFKNKSNISKHERPDILNLKKNKDIIIKETVMTVIKETVIMNTKHYLKMISDYFNGETAYKMVKANCDERDSKSYCEIER